MGEAPVRVEIIMTDNQGHEYTAEFTTRDEGEALAKKEIKERLQATIIYGQYRVLHLDGPEDVPFTSWVP